MTLAARKFGTDLSNSGPKTVKGTKPAKRFEGGENLVNGKPVKETREKVLSAPTPQDIVPPLSPLRTDAPEFKISISQPKPSESPLQYDRDFLLQFQNICTEPLQGILTEVIKGQYVKPIFHPSPKKDSFGSPTASPIKIIKSYSARPASGVKPTLASNGSLPSTPTKLKPAAWNTGISPLPSPLATGADEAIVPSDAPMSPVPSKVLTSPASPNIVAIPFDLKPRTPKAARPRETDPKRIAARKKQIEIGMNTVGYKIFTATVPSSQRTKDHPRIPDPLQICSKRSWDGQVRKWRRMLHDYDPIEMKMARQKELAEKNELGHEEDGEYVPEEDVSKLELEMELASLQVDDASQQ